MGPGKPAEYPALSDGGNGLSDLRVALVHYWFVSLRGGERVVEALADLFPQADLYALVAKPGAMPAQLRAHKLRTSFLQRLPGSVRWHRRLLPLYPYALEQFDLRDYDLVISSESGPAKGVLTSARTCHICYCHSPMRYLWDMYPHYRNENGLGRTSRLFFSFAAHYVRQWDYTAAARVDHFVANSENVARRIRKHYRREAEVIPAPVDFSAGYLTRSPKDYYLAVGQLVDYKRIDLAIAACNRLGRPLRVVGDGEQYRSLKRLAGPTVELLGRLSDEELHHQYAHCRALLFPGEEDFGIVPVEAQTFGRPVIAYARGGALETVSGLYPGEEETAAESTGVFFAKQSVEALIEAIHTFEAAESRFSPPFIRAQVERFDVSHFRTRFRQFVLEKYEEFQKEKLPVRRFISVGAI